MHNFKKLDVWNLSIEFVKEVYQYTENFPRNEIYGITNQMRRAAVSIPSNISEGAGRGSNGEFRLFLGYAYGSCCELETQIIICQKLGFMDTSTQIRVTKRLVQIEKMIFKLMGSL